MYLNPNARIHIGKDANILEFNGVNKVEIYKTVKELGNTAVVRLPRNYKELDGKSILELMTAGDPVTIWLGYNGEYNEEFKGYIKTIESNTPLVLQLDDEFYPLKRNTFNTSFPKGVTLREILEYVSSGYEIDCPDVVMEGFQISNVSTYEVLTAIKEQYGFYTRIDGNVLRCLWAYDMVNFSKHTYTFYTETVKTNNLSYRRAEDVQIKLKAISNLRTGKKLKYETGSNEKEASVRTLNFGPLSESELKERAEQEYKRLVFDGFSGTITGFGNPRTNPGDTLEIINPKEPDQNGEYLIDDVTIIYDLNLGYERKNTPSYKL